MDEKMRERLIMERDSYRRERLKELEEYKKLQELKEKDPEAYKKIMRKIRLKRVFILLFCVLVFFWFRYYDACHTPDSLCDFVWWWEYGKKCYACSVKGLLYLEERKESVDSTCVNLECPEWTRIGCITWSRWQCKSCKCYDDLNED